MSGSIGFLAFIVFFAMVMGSAMWMLNYEKQEKIAKGKRDIPADWLSRDYENVPAVNLCPRCGSKVHVTTTVEIPPINSEPGKLEFNKYAIKILYSVRCNSCSLGTGNREEMAEVMNDWNSQRITQQG